MAISSRQMLCYNVEEQAGIRSDDDGTVEYVPREFGFGAGSRLRAWRRAIVLASAAASVGLVCGLVAATGGKAQPRRSEEAAGGHHFLTAEAEVARGEVLDGLLLDDASERALQKALCGGDRSMCGGEGYGGPTCCADGLECVSTPLKSFPSYRQCRPIVKQCEDMDGRLDHPCYYKVKWDMTKGIYQSPQNYHGLTAQSSFKEFQEQNWMLMKDNSKCPPPCGPGTCFQVLRYEGCDQHNEWGCERDDGTLGFDCCCKKYHVNLTAKAFAHASAKKPGAPSLFCVALMQPRTYEVDLLREQLRRGKLGMFGCDKWAVISNESISLNPESGSDEFKTVVMEGSLEARLGGDYNTSMNTPIFTAFWKKVFNVTGALHYDWIVKMDPDTLFLPDRLQALLASKKGALSSPEPKAGRFINNCFLGMHGPIEVFSRQALLTYRDHTQQCIDGAAGKHGQEDWFMRDCLQELGVQKVDAYNLLLEGDWACKERPSAKGDDYRPPCFSPQVAFHPFKDIHSYTHCWAEAISVRIPNPLDPISDVPTPANERHG